MPTEIYAVLLGVFVGGFITYYFSVKLAAKQQRLISAANLRASFSYTISQMAIAQTDKNISIESLLVRTFPDLATAVETFRPFVHCKDRQAYQEAWENYYQVGRSVRFFDYYMKDPLEKESKPYEVFTQRIEAFLKYAKL